MSKHKHKNTGTHVIDELSRHKITVAAVAASLAVRRERVDKALDVSKFHTMRYADLYRVRRKVEAFLRLAGWQGNPVDLWCEYDDRITPAQVAA